MIARSGPRRFRAARQAAAAAASPSQAAQLVALYLEHLRGGALSSRGRPYSPKTIVGYEEALRAFLRVAGELGLPDDVRKLTADHLRRYGAELRRRGAKPATVNDRVRALAPWFNWLVARGVLRRSPIVAGVVPKPGDARKHGLRGEDVQRVLDACEAGTWLGARDLAIVWLLVDTGLRAGELVALDLVDVDRVAWMVQVRHGKGDKPRVARLGQEARLVVGEWIALWRGDEPGPLFPGVRAERLRRDGLTQLIARLGRKAGVPLHPHLLRHTFATQFLRAGGDLAQLQLLLGHTTLEMVRRYTAALNEEDALASHVAASPGDTLGLLRKRPRRR